MNPKISIITITFNSEETLEETIKSVVTQNYDNLEYIIIDGGSNDSTLAIVDNYKKYISLVVSEPDNGISDAFNKGIRKATGEIIGIINSDDLLLPGALQTLADSYDQQVDVYRGNTVLWNPQTDSKLSTRPTMEFPITKRVKSVCHQSTFITKRAYNQYGCYDVSFRYMMDADLLHRFYNKGARFKYIDRDLAVFRQGGVTSDNWKKKLSELKKMILKNGGSSIYAYYRIAKFSIYNIGKTILFRTIGGDLSRRLRHKI